MIKSYALLYSLSSQLNKKIFVKYLVKRIKILNKFVIKRVNVSQLQ